MSDDTLLKTGSFGLGWPRIDFKDCYEHECSIQKSSIATVDAIWFGINEANPQILAKDADKINPDTGEKTGWIKFDVPDEVLMTTRMHLTQRQVADLLPILSHFARTGQLPKEYPEIRSREDREDDEAECLEVCHVSSL